jgi:hypothetical protein
MPRSLCVIVSCIGIQGEVVEAAAFSVFREAGLVALLSQNDAPQLRMLCLGDVFLRINGLLCDPVRTEWKAPFSVDCASRVAKLAVQCLTCSGVGGRLLGMQWDSVRTPVFNGTVANKHDV